MKFKDYLNEVRMSPSALKSFASSSPLQVGFELEVFFDDVEKLTGKKGVRFDYDITPNVIANFFSMSDDAFDKLDDDYQRWKSLAGSRGQISTTFLSYMTSKSIFSFSDFAEVYGYDLPHGYDEASDDPYLEFINTAKAIAAKFAKDLNVEEPTVFGEHNEATKVSTKWTFEPDDSIKANFGIEMVSPVYSSISEGLTALKNVFAWLKENGAETNASCGLHINVSGEGHNKLDMVKLVLFLGDEHLLAEFGRETNRYCESMYRNMKDALSRDPEFVEKQLRLMRNGVTRIAADQLQSRRDLGKYVSVNLKRSHVEFRSVGSDYLSMEDKVINAVSRCAQAYALAIDNKAEVEEYRKKYYKLVMSNKRGDETFEKIMALFARYAAGNFDLWNTKEMIKKKIAKFQAQRKTGEKPGPWPFE
jgi:hypothetical protein